MNRPVVQLQQPPMRSGAAKQTMRDPRGRRGIGKAARELLEIADSILAAIPAWCCRSLVRFTHGAFLLPCDAPIMDLGRGTAEAAGQSNPSVARLLVPE